MKKSTNHKCTLRFEWAKDAKTQKLYIDIYPATINAATGKPTRRKWLGYSVTPLCDRGGNFRKAKTGALRLAPKATEYFVYSANDANMLQIAETACKKLETELAVNAILNVDEQKQLAMQNKSKTAVADFIASIKENKSDSMRATVEHLLYYWNGYIESIDKPGLQFCDVTFEICDEFKNYLFHCSCRRKPNEHLKKNTISSFFSVFKTILCDAYKRDYMPRLIMIDGVEAEQTHREYLTTDELKQLIATPCQWDYLRRAAIFSTLAGLRYSDLVRLKWKNFVIGADGGVWLDFRIKKTKVENLIAISKEAMKICGEPGKPEDAVFKGIGKTSSDKMRLKAWVAASGIDKHITFHCLRHTFAMRMLNDAHQQITTVQKLLGHKSMNSTMIYAKVQNSLQRDAVDNPDLSIL